MCRPDVATTYLESDADAEAMHDPLERREYYKTIEVLLDVLRVEDGEELWDGIEEKLWLLVGDALGTRHGRRVLPRTMEPQDMSQRLLWHMLRFISAELWAVRD